MKFIPLMNSIYSHQGNGFNIRHIQFQLWCNRLFKKTVTFLVQFVVHPLL